MVGRIDCECEECDSPAPGLKTRKGIRLTSNIEKWHYIEPEMTAYLMKLMAVYGLLPATGRPCPRAPLDLFLSCCYGVVSESAKAKRREGRRTREPKEIPRCRNAIFLDACERCRRSALMFDGRCSESRLSCAC